MQRAREERQSPVELTVIMPAFNEEENVGRLYQRLVEHVAALGREFELIFVDDGSKDATYARLVALAKSDPRVVVIKLRRNYGQTPAMTAGIDAARGSILVTMDADLQNDPADIGLLLTTLEEGYDIVVGYRMRRQDKFLSRKLPSIVANWLIGKVTGLPVRDNGCSLKAYRASVIKRIPLYSEMHRFIPAMAIPFGVSVAQVGVRHHARQFGTSKYGLSRIYKVILDLITIKTVLVFARRPLAIFSLASLIAGLIAVAVGFQAVGLAGDAAGEPSVVFTTVALLFGSLSIFLLASGFVAALADVGASLSRRTFP